MEFLNSERNESLYEGDPLAPAQYDPDCLFATTMFASPLAWFENTGLSQDYIKRAAPVIAEWKKERQAIYSGVILPIGDVPDGASWTGFASISPRGQGGYILVFREMNQASDWQLPKNLFDDRKYTVHILAGGGRIETKQMGFGVHIARPLGYVWAKLEPIR
jgi:alpha-galactosidase